MNVWTLLYPAQSARQMLRVREFVSSHSQQTETEKTTQQTLYW